VSAGVSAYGIYTYGPKYFISFVLEPLCDRKMWIKDDDGDDGGEPKTEPRVVSNDVKKWYKNKFLVTCIVGVIRGSNVLASTLFGDRGIPSPISLVGDLCIAGVGVFLTFSGLNMAWVYYSCMKTVLMNTAECCVIARAGFATPFLIVPACVGFFMAGKCSYTAINRGMKTVKHIRDGTAEWDVVLFDESFWELVETLSK